ncbi:MULTISPECIES: RCC1 domain-containing protein [Cysteiniphilum]|nr:MULTISPECIES: hypothetical protein [Cysteiniphilum]
MYRLACFCVLILLVSCSNNQQSKQSQEIDISIPQTITAGTTQTASIELKQVNQFSGTSNSTNVGMHISDISNCQNKLIITPSELILQPNVQQSIKITAPNATNCKHVIEFKSNEVNHFLHDYTVGIVAVPVARVSITDTEGLPSNYVTQGSTAYVQFSSPDNWQGVTTNQSYIISPNQNSSYFSYTTTANTKSKATCILNPGKPKQNCIIAINTDAKLVKGDYEFTIKQAAHTSILPSISHFTLHVDGLRRASLTIDVPNTILQDSNAEGILSFDYDNNQTPADTSFSRKINFQDISNCKNKLMVSPNPINIDESITTYTFAINTPNAPCTHQLQISSDSPLDPVQPVTINVVDTPIANISILNLDGQQRNTFKQSDQFEIRITPPNDWANIQKLQHYTIQSNTSQITLFNDSGEASTHCTLSPDKPSQPCILKGKISDKAENSQYTIALHPSAGAQLLLSSNDLQLNVDGKEKVHGVLDLPDMQRLGAQSQATISLSYNNVAATSTSDIRTISMHDVSNCPTPLKITPSTITVPVDHSQAAFNITNIDKDECLHTIHFESSGPFEEIVDHPLQSLETPVVDVSILPSIHHNMTFNRQEQLKVIFSSPDNWKNIKHDQSYNVKITGIHGVQDVVPGNFKCTLNYLFPNKDCTVVITLPDNLLNDDYKIVIEPEDGTIMPISDNAIPFAIDGEYMAQVQAQWPNKMYIDETMTMPLSLSYSSNVPLSNLDIRSITIQDTSKCPNKLIISPQPLLIPVNGMTHNITISSQKKDTACLHHLQVQVSGLATTVDSIPIQTINLPLIQAQVTNVSGEPINSVDAGTNFNVVFSWSSHFPKPVSDQIINVNTSLVNVRYSTTANGVKPNQCLLNDRHTTCTVTIHTQENKLEQFQVTLDMDKGAIAQLGTDFFNLKLYHDQWQKMSSSISYHNMCAISDAGKAFCWGENHHGQLGGGSHVNGDFPVPVDTSGALYGLDIIDIAVGNNFACAIANNQKAYCWGDNANGQLGTEKTGGIAISPVAVQMQEQRAVNIYVGDKSACFLTTTHDLYCWGNNKYGQLGNGTLENTNIPVKVDFGGLLQNNEYITKASLQGSTACAISNLGKLYCWGWNNYTIDWSTADKTKPSYVFNTPSGFIHNLSIKAVNVTRQMICAVTSDGQTYCWGGYLYPLINGYMGFENVQAVAKDQKTQNISLYANTLCAISNTGKIYCQGGNTYGQTGVGSKESIIYTPTQINHKNIDTDIDFKQLTVGERAACAIDDNQHLYCWGYARLLANGFSNNSNIPVELGK